MQERKAENLQKIPTRNPKNPDSQQGLDYWTETHKTVESLAKEVIDNPDNASTYYLLGCWLMKHYNLKEASAKVLERGLEVDPKHKFMKSMLEHIQHDLSLEEFCVRLDRNGRQLLSDIKDS